MVAKQKNPITNMQLLCMNILFIQADVISLAGRLIAREAGALMGHVGVVPAEIPVELYGDQVAYATPGIFQNLLDVLRSSQ